MASSTEPVDQSEASAEQITIYERQTLRFEGPLPPPELLQQFKDVDSTFPERIVAMAERQAEHRQSMEQTALNARIQVAQQTTITQRLGQRLGFVVAMGFLGGSVFTAYIGHPTLAGIIGSSTVVSLVVVFVTGKAIRSKSAASDSAADEKPDE